MSSMKDPYKLVSRELGIAWRHIEEAAKAMLRAKTEIHTKGSTGVGWALDLIRKAEDYLDKAQAEIGAIAEDD